MAGKERGSNKCIEMYRSREGVEQGKVSSMNFFHHLSLPHLLISQLLQHPLCLLHIFLGSVKFDGVFLGVRGGERDPHTSTLLHHRSHKFPLGADDCSVELVRNGDS